MGLTIPTTRWIWRGEPPAISVVTIPGVLASCTSVRPMPRPTAQSVHLPSSLSLSALLATLFALFVLFFFSCFLLLFSYFFMLSFFLPLPIFFAHSIPFLFLFHSLYVSTLFFFFSFSLPISPPFSLSSSFLSFFLLVFLLLSVIAGTGVDCMSLCCNSWLQTALPEQGLQVQ